MDTVSSCWLSLLLNQINCCCWFQKRIQKESIGIPPVYCQPAIKKQRGTSLKLVSNELFFEITSYSSFVFEMSRILAWGIYLPELPTHVREVLTGRQQSNRKLIWLVLLLLRQINKSWFKRFLRYVRFHIGYVLVYIGMICYFYLRHCGWKTTNSPDYCFEVSGSALLFSSVRELWASAVAAAESANLFDLLLFLFSIQTLHCRVVYPFCFRHCGSQSN